MSIPTRADALALLNELITKESLKKHSLCVESVMRHYARMAGEDEEVWGIAGLIHDLDYEKYPDQHCYITVGLLRERNWPEEYINAVLSHAWGICTDQAPTTRLEKTLYTVDELAGFVVACVLVRPSKSINDLEAPSVMKKWRQKDFAATVDRTVVERGAQLLGSTVEEITKEVILALRGDAKELGLAGT